MNTAALSLPPPSQLEPGDWVMEKYQIEKVLGTGAMGIVYRALHADLARYVAVKVVRPELLHHPSVVGRMLTEARAAAQLSSEYAVRVLDVGELPNGYPFIVMEYLDGEDLQTILDREGPFELTRAVDYVLQACTALAEAHQCGIVHRDIKPANLFLTRRSDGTPIIKVFDFGISKQVDRLGSAPSLTQANTLVGSPHYMAPEQMRGIDAIDERADIWSLGVLLHELVTGAMPFEGEAFAVICASVLNTPAISVRAVRPELPETFAEVVLRCLEKPRERRFASVLELKKALEPFGGTQYFTESGVRSTVDGRFSAVRADGTSAAPIVPSTSQKVRPRLRLKQKALLFGLLGATLGLGYVRLVRETGGQEVRARGFSQRTELAQPSPAPAPTPPRAEPRQTSVSSASLLDAPQTPPAAGTSTNVMSRRALGSLSRPRNTEPAPATSSSPTSGRVEPRAPNPFDPEEFGGRR